MSRLKQVQSWLVLGLVISALPGCPAKTKTSESDSTSGGTFTAADLIGSGTSACIAATGGVPGTNHYVSTIAFTAGNNFTYTQMWYSAAGCSPVNYAAFYEIIGTYTVGGVISASSSLQSITFTVNSSYLAPYSAANVTYINAFCSNPSYVLGTLRTTYMATCSFVTTPNSANKTVYNVVGMGGGHLSIGAPDEGISGTFSSGSVPTTATLTF